MGKWPSQRAHRPTPHTQLNQIRHHLKLTVVALDCGRMNRDGMSEIKPFKAVADTYMEDIGSRLSVLGPSDAVSKLTSCSNPAGQPFHSMGEYHKIDRFLLGRAKKKVAPLLLAIEPPCPGLMRWSTSPARTTYIVVTGGSDEWTDQ